MQISTSFKSNQKTVLNYNNLSLNSIKSPYDLKEKLSPIDYLKFLSLFCAFPAAAKTDIFLATQLNKIRTQKIKYFPAAILSLSVFLIHYSLNSMPQIKLKLHPSPFKKPGDNQNEEIILPGKKIKFREVLKTGLTLAGGMGIDLILLKLMKIRDINEIPFIPCSIVAVLKVLLTSVRQKDEHLNQSIKNLDKNVLKKIKERSIEELEAQNLITQKLIKKLKEENL